MSETPRLALPLLEAAQAQKHVTHNEALSRLDALVQSSVIDRTLTAPPSGPSAGDAYIVGPSPTGYWAGHTGQLAVYYPTGWTYHVPQIGWVVWVVAESRPVVWTGSDWTPFPQAVGTFADLAGLGIGTAPDATNRLSVRSAAALLAAQPVASGGTGSMRLTIEKESFADTASLLFQTAWSGRAEIGLAGDDDLHLKVSADGSTWIEALRIAAATGQLVPIAGGIAGGGRLKSMSWFTASGTWTRPAGIRLALVLALGGGGGGGGAAGLASSGAAGAGGGSGSLAISLLDVTAITSRTVTIGAGGGAGASTGGTGGSGGTTSFGTEVVAAGASGGAGMAAGTTIATGLAGAGGTASAGDMLFVGSPGATAIRLDATTIVAGVGVVSFFGGGGRGAVTNSNGGAGTARGAGGSGGAVSNNATGRAGGAGGAGLVWVWEFE
jgi:hypothetical protein